MTSRPFRVLFVGAKVASSVCQRGEGSRMQGLFAVLLLVVAVTAEEPRCEGRYGNGDTWTKEDRGMYYECTCSVSNGWASYNCIPKSCRHEGSVYRVGQEWYTRDRSMKCKCSATQKGTQWSCDPVSNGGDNEPKCQGRYRNGEQWTTFQNGVPFRCTCTISGGRFNIDCQPQGLFCRYNGRVYKVGDTWREMGWTCNCYKNGSSTRWSCS